jgi:hypothetical protein
MLLPLLLGCVNRFSECRVRSGKEGGGGTDDEFMESGQWPEKVWEPLFYTF